MTLPPSDIPFAAQPLEYAADRPPRPGILTAVGVMSIVLGSLSILFSLAGVGQGVIYIILSRVTVPAMAIPQPLPTAAAAPTTLPAGSSNASFSAVYAQNGGTPSNVNSAIPFPFHIGAGPSILMIVEGSLSFCAAILLIVAGSLMLRNSPKSDRLHRIYVYLKVPLVMAAAVATYWMYSAMMSGIGSMSQYNAGASHSFTFATTFALFEAIIMAAFALAYPVALLIVLTRKSSQAYFLQVRGTIRK
jgi:hypothetical protein